MQCRLCDEEYADNPWVVKDDPTVCDRCHMALYGRFGRCGHGLSGTSDGPCFTPSKTHFNTPKPYEETLKAAKAVEAAGRMTPKAEAFFRNRLKGLESHKGGDGTDYQKTGYPV